MSTRLTVALFVILACPSGILAQPGMLDLIPADATLAVALQSPDDLKTKGDQLFKDVDLNLGIRPTEALDQLVNFLGVRPGLDLRGPFVLALLPNPDGGETPLDALVKNFVVALPVADRDRMAANFGFGKGEMIDGKVVAVKQAPQDFIKFAALRGGHILFGNRDVILQRALQGRPLVGRLSANQRETFGTADLLVHFNPKPLKNEWGSFRKDLQQELDRWPDPQDQKTAQQFGQALDHFQFALVGARVAKGLGLDVLVSIDETAVAVKELLGSLRAGEAAHLNGLPAGRLVATQAHAGAGTRTGLFARAFAYTFLRHVLETKQFTSAVDRSMFLGVLSDAWDRLRGSRVGVYLTRDEPRLGLFSLVAILDTADAGQFLADLRSLARMADGTLDLTKPDVRQEVNIPKLVADLGHDRFAIRNSATTKLRLLGEPALPELEKAAAAGGDPERVQRANVLIADITAVAAERRKELLAKDLPRYVRPTFAWVARAETRLGQPVDIVHVKPKEADRPAVVAMKQYFGPDWDKIRMAMRGRQVVVLLGSEVELFEQALKNLPARGSALAEISPVKAGPPVARFQISVDLLSSLINGQPRRAPGPLTSLAVSVPDAGVQVGVHIPVEDLRAIVKPGR
jgi:hypothetical protein